MRRQRLEATSSRGNTRPTYPERWLKEEGSYWKEFLVQHPSPSTCTCTPWQTLLQLWAGTRQLCESRKYVCRLGPHFDWRTEIHLRSSSSEPCIWKQRVPLRSRHHNWGLWRAQGLAGGLGKKGKDLEDGREFSKGKRKVTHPFPLCFTKCNPTPPHCQRVSLVGAHLTTGKIVLTSRGYSKWEHLEESCKRRVLKALRW